MNNNPIRNMPQSEFLLTRVQPIEVFLSTYKSLLFLSAFVVIVTLWAAGVFSEFYEFLAIMSTITLGLLISRLQYVKFWGLEVATDQYMQFIQFRLLYEHYFPAAAQAATVNRAFSPDRPVTESVEGEISE